jgi:hypothetical protein
MLSLHGRQRMQLAAASSVSQSGQHGLNLSERISSKIGPNPLPGTCAICAGLSTTSSRVWRLTGGQVFDVVGSFSIYGIYYPLLGASCLVAKIQEKGNIMKISHFLPQDSGSRMGCIKCESFLNVLFHVRLEFRHPSSAFCGL